jgi:hypothetical protein
VQPLQLVNQLPLEFDGFIQLVDAGQEYDLKFKTPTSSFKKFLRYYTHAYASSLDNVKTTGDFTVAGFQKGYIQIPQSPNSMSLSHQITLRSSRLPNLFKTS